MLRDCVIAKWTILQFYNSDSSPVLTKEQCVKLTSLSFYKGVGARAVVYAIKDKQESFVSYVLPGLRL